MSITSLEVELWEEPFEIPNENGRKNSYVPNYNASQYLKEIQLRNRAKAFNGNLDDTSVYRDDGNSKVKRYSIASDATSGVFSSFSLNVQGSKYESSNLKLCPSVENNGAIADNNQGNLEGSKESIIFKYCNSQDSVTSEVSYDPCFIAETVEDHYEATIHHTAISPRVDYISKEDNSYQNCNLVSIREANNGDFRKNDLCSKRYYLRDVDEISQYNEPCHSLDEDKEIRMSEPFSKSESFLYSLATVESEEDLLNAEVHEYFDIQRRALRRQDRFGPIGMQIAQNEIEKEIDAKIERGIPKNMEPFQNLIATPRECLREDYSPICPVPLDDDEELLIEELEYVHTREFSSYDKYTQGPFNYHPMPMDDILEERINFPSPRICWMCPSIANEYHGDSLTAVVPFASEMREEDREHYPKQKLTLKEKIRKKLRKFKKFLTRKNRAVKLDHTEEDLQCRGDDQELFLIQVEGSWNICYEAEAIEEQTNAEVTAIVSLGQYCPPDYDEVRKIIAKDPSLCTIVEEDEEIKADTSIDSEEEFRLD